METLKYLGVALAILAVVIVLRKNNGDFSKTLIVFFSFAIIKTVFGMLFENTDILTGLLSLGGGEIYGNTLMKAVGIALISECACDLCSTFGENELGDKIILLAKGELLYLALPLIKKLTDLTRSLAG